MKGDGSNAPSLSRLRFAPCHLLQILLIIEANKFFWIRWNSLGATISLYKIVNA
ncbi:MAG: hypothetical protein F7B11_00425 [Caldisphaeraceae archaeon]|nr:hypothetical protein [Caldisphaeraceae archaeon]